MDIKLRGHTGEWTVGVCLMLLGAWPVRGGGQTAQPVGEIMANAPLIKE